MEISLPACGGHHRVGLASLVKSLQDRAERFDSSKRVRPHYDLYVRDPCVGELSEDLCEFIWPSGQGWPITRPEPGRHDLDPIRSVPMHTDRSPQGRRIAAHLFAGSIELARRWLKIFRETASTVAPIKLTTTSWLSSRLPRQF